MSPKIRKQFFENIAKNKGILVPSQQMMEEALKLGMPVFTIEETLIERKTKDEDTALGSMIDKGSHHGLLPLYQTLQKDSFYSL